MAYKAVLLAVLSSAVLSGCGGSDSDSEESTLNNYSLSGLARVAASESIAGTWVAVANGSSKSVQEDGFWEERDFSRKAFFTVRENEGSYSISQCNSDFSSIDYSSTNNTVTIFNSDGFGSTLDVQDNNYAFGSVDNDRSNGGYEKYDVEYMKVSNSTTGVGEVKVDWSGASSSSDTADDIFALCLKNIDEMDSDGDSSKYIHVNVGILAYDRSVELKKGTYYSEAEEYVFVRGSNDTVSESLYWGGNASVDYSQTVSSFTATANATENSGESVSITVNAALPTQ